MAGRLHRRALLAGLTAGAAAAWLAGCTGPTAAEGAPPPAGRRPNRADARFRTALADLERQAGGRLGVAVFLPAAGRAVGWRGAERFGLCSTFKLALAAQALHAADRGVLPLDRRLPYGEADLLSYAPAVRAHLAEGGMTVAALCEAAVTLSDNSAANLLLARLGGPAGFTGWMRALGDGTTRLDANEPALNYVMPGTVENTTAPLAMARAVARLLAADGPLSPAARAQLADWLRRTDTGLRRLRAGLPAGWDAGDKTGSASDSRPGGMVNKYNDIATIWRPSGDLAVIAAYYDAAAHYPTLRPEDEAVLARAGRIAAQWIGEEA